MPVFLVLLIALIVVPMSELYLLIEVGRSIGAVTTIALVILTAIIGAWLLRWQGLVTLARVRESLDQGQLPAVEMVEGLILLVTGVMLLTPGFITDAIGFACLIPQLRRTFALMLASRLVVRAGGSGARPSQHGPYTIEGDFEVDNKDNKNNERLNDL